MSCLHPQILSAVVMSVQAKPFPKHDPIFDGLLRSFEGKEPLYQVAVNTRVTRNANPEAYLFQTVQKQVKRLPMRPFG
ncbi:unnamed protein product [Darwinula stevensoni]|uniref:Uncharacterized protein n=1 Tax=Darwinula stevensoni TaxID=69355 RepID=A0A7R9ACS9_9CRUS|nr:unnamed protein product [Darwinula stevensoni]CAG0900661.1 unnamed protein product [Darwinula stevensoni]